MLSIICPTYNSGVTLQHALSAAAGIADEIIITDGGSDDETCAIAASEGARVISGLPGRGAQLAAGANAATGDWLLFIHSDTVLSADAAPAIQTHMARADGHKLAAYFELAFDDASSAARRTAFLANWRADTLGLPYGDQGLLISRKLYEETGGFKAIPLMEDVDLIRRIGRKRLLRLGGRATTSAAKYRRAGWISRSARNLLCLSLYFLGVSPARIAKIYG